MRIRAGAALLLAWLAGASGLDAQGLLGNDTGKGPAAVPDIDGDGANELLIPAYGANKVYLFKGGATLLALGATGTTASAFETFSSTAENAVAGGAKYGHALGSFDQRGHCSGVEHGVVVQEEDVVGLGGHVGPQAPTHCPGEPEVAFARQDPVRS